MLYGLKCVKRRNLLPAAAMFSAGELIPKDRVLPEMQDKVSESRSADLGVAGCFMQTTPGFQTSVYADGDPTDEPPVRHLHYHIPG